MWTFFSLKYQYIIPLTRYVISGASDTPTSHTAYPFLAKTARGCLRVRKACTRVHCTGDRWDKGIIPTNKFKLIFCFILFPKSYLSYSLLCYIRCFYITRRVFIIQQNIKCSNIAYRIERVITPLPLAGSSSVINRTEVRTRQNTVFILK